MKSVFTLQLVSEVGSYDKVPKEAGNRQMAALFAKLEEQAARQKQFYREQGGNWNSRAVVSGGNRETSTATG